MRRKQAHAGFTTLRGTDALSVLSSPVLVSPTYMRFVSVNLFFLVPVYSLRQTLTCQEVCKRLGLIIRRSG